MKTSLPKQSKEHQERIKSITDLIIKAGHNHIAFIILFGSFARGNWIQDQYVEENITYEYASDYDFLVITKSNKKENGEGISTFELERRIDKEIENSNYLNSAHIPHLIIEPIDYVNSRLEKSQYFFLDIVKEGVLLYDSKEFELSSPRELTSEEKREIAKEEYEHWFGKNKEFLEHYQLDIEKKYYKTAAFHLHQAAESLYNCALLVLTNYKPKTHDLRKLNKLCATQLNDFLTIFPLATKEQKESFKLLQKGYVEARYNKHYTISKEQLKYLISRVEKLKNLVVDICKSRI